MTQQSHTPPSEPLSEQDAREFQQKFDEWAAALSDREQLQAASIVTLSFEEESSEAEQVGENQSVEPLSEEEIEEFTARLNSFHDSLPEGQHQILDSITAKACIHLLPESEEEDVQGNVWLWNTYRLYEDNPYFRDWISYWRSKCSQQGGTLYQRGRDASQGMLGEPRFYRWYGCWR